MAAPLSWKKVLGGQGWPQVSSRLVPASLSRPRHGFWHGGAAIVTDSLTYVQQNHLEAC